MDTHARVMVHVARNGYRIASPYTRQWIRRASRAFFNPCLDVLITPGLRDLSRISPAKRLRVGRVDHFTRGLLALLENFRSIVSLIERFDTAKNAVIPHRPSHSVRLFSHLRSFRPPHGDYRTPFGRSNHHLLLGSFRSSRNRKTRLIYRNCRRPRILKAPAELRGRASFRLVKRREGVRRRRAAGEATVSSSSSRGKFSGFHGRIAIPTVFPLSIRRRRW